MVREQPERRNGDVLLFSRPALIERRRALDLGAVSSLHGAMRNDGFNLPSMYVPVFRFFCPARAGGEPANTYATEDVIGGQGSMIGLEGNNSKCRLVLMKNTALIWRNGAKPH